MKVLVTGASGCIGRAVVRALAGNSIEVRAVDRQTPADGDDVDCERLCVDLTKCDFGEIVAGCDAVLHLAALVHRPDITDPTSYRALNVDLTRHLVRAARGQRFLLSSTVAVYGREDLEDADETVPCEPRTAYARSKLDAEEIVTAAGGAVFRFPVVYGPGDKGNVARLIRAVVRGRFVFPGRCERPRSMVASANAAVAVVQWLRAGAPSGVHIVTDNNDVTVRALVETVMRYLPDGRRVKTIPLMLARAAGVVGSALEQIGVPVPLSYTQVRKLTTRNTFSCLKAMRSFGYHPTISVADAIRVAVHDCLRRPTR